MPWLVAHLGRRDGYEAAAAFAERSDLHMLLTDIYRPGFLGNWAHLVPGTTAEKLRSRAHPAVPAQLVKALLPRLIWESVHEARGTSRDDIFGRQVAGQLARCASLGLVYSPYAGSAMQTLAERAPEVLPRVAVFQVHPTAATASAILALDRELSGIADGFEPEEQTTSEERHAEEFSLTRAHRVVTASTFTAASVKALGVDAERVSVVPYGCPVDVECVGYRPPSQRPLELLWIGQLAYRKAPHHLMKAISALPPGTANLTVVTRSAVPTWLTVPPGVVVREANDAELRRLMLVSDLLVMPSLVEGFGLVFTEALAHGLPVLGTPNTGLPDLGEGEQDGLLTVPPGSPEAITETLIHLRESMWRLPEMRTAARRTAQALTWQRFRSRLVAELGNVG